VSAIPDAASASRPKPVDRLDRTRFRTALLIPPLTMIRDSDLSKTIARVPARIPDVANDEEELKGIEHRCARSVATDPGAQRFRGQRRRLDRRVPPHWLASFGFTLPTQKKQGPPHQRSAKLNLPSARDPANSVTNTAQSQNP